MTPMTTTDQAAWVDVVKHIADVAHTRLPAALHSRLEMATALNLFGMVRPDEAGTGYQVLNSKGTEWLHVNGSCPCQDYERAPEHLCKHTLSTMIYFKAQKQLAQQAPAPAALPAVTPEPSQTQDASTMLPAAAAPAASLPEAPCSANVHVTIGGRDVQVTVRGYTLAEVLPQIEALTQRYPTPAPQAAAQGEGKDWCQKHGVAMKLNHGKDGRTWHSHKTAEGRWCKGR